MAGIYRVRRMYANKNVLHANSVELLQDPNL